MFFLQCTKNFSSKTDYVISPWIKLTQHSRDILILNSLISSLEYGSVIKHSKDAKVFIVLGFNSLNNKIISLFNDY
jgi:hypothetical protein